MSAILDIWEYFQEHIYKHIFYRTTLQGDVIFTPQEGNALAVPVKEGISQRRSALSGYAASETRDLELVGMNDQQYPGWENPPEMRFTNGSGTGREPDMQDCLSPASRRSLKIAPIRTSANRSCKV